MMNPDVELGLARFWGILTVVLSVSGLTPSARRAMKEAKTQDGLIFTLGLITLICGALQVSFYNVWELNYRGFVTVAGWLALVRSSLRLLWPASNKKAFEDERSEKVVIGSTLVSAVLGAWLIAVSFGWVWGGPGT